MKILLTYLLLLLSHILVSQNDSLKMDSTKIKKSVGLDEVVITAEKDNTFGISGLHNVEGTTIYAGKKTEAIYLNDLNANLAANNSRQIFAKVAGINIFENDGAGSSIGIGGRGLNPNRISNFNTRQNGYDISADALGYPESYYVPPSEAIERIEILRGAASLQFGTQFGGMINYKFNTPSQKKIAVLSRQTLGSFNFFNSFNQISGTIKKFSYSAFYNYKTYKGWRPNAQLNSHTGYVQLGYRFNDRIFVKSEFTHLQYLNQQPGGLTDKQFLKDPSQSNRERNWFKVNWNLYNLNADFKLTDRTRLNVLLFGVYAGRDALGTLERIDRQDDTTKNRNLLSDIYNNYAAEIRLLHRYTFLNKQSNVLVGVRAYKGTTDRKQGDADKTTQSNFNFLNPNDLENSAYQFPSTNFAAFSENIFQLTSQWNVTPGIRWEYINTNSNGYYRLLNKDLAGNVLLDKKIEDSRTNTRSFVLLGIGTQYKMKKVIEFYANFSQNYRSINFNDMRVVNPNFQVDPNLKDESGFTADGGIKGVIKDVLYFDVSVFLLKYKNRIGTVLKVDSSTYQIVRYRTNVSDSKNTGVEAFAELDWLKLFNKNTKHKLSTFVNTSMINAIYVSSQQSGFNNKKVEYVPEFIIRTGLTYAFKKIGITCQYAYTSQQFSDASNAISTPSAIYGLIPSYSVVDVSANYSYKFLGVSAGINNALNASYFTRRAEGYPGPGIIPSDPLNIYMTLSLKL
jgi:Fe(3+) dicitrate transport protein